MYPSPAFQKSFERANGYQVSTPYGTISITQDGRRITFQFYEDVRQSIHHKALFSYYQQICRRDPSAINVDHLDLADLDRSLDLKRGRARLDMVYILKGQIHEVELKTHREVGLDRTSTQLIEMSRYCQNLTIVVPRRDMENARTILAMIGLDKRVAIDSYELLEDEEDEIEA